MFTLVILYTLYTPIYYCIPCIPLYTLCNHVYPSSTLYPVYPYISCVPMFTLKILYTCIPLYILCTHVYPSNTVHPVYPYIP
ncbi:unnamed protein product, partial [Porites lobata]